MQNRKRRPVNHGSSQVELGDDALAAPVEFYVGNTTPAVKAVLMKCAKGVDTNTQFKVLEVVQLAKHIENPRTKCWKVVVPYKCKDIMEKDDMYPAGWCHRKFFFPRSSGHPSKQLRKDDQIVQDVIQEQQRTEEGKRQEQEDRLRMDVEEQSPSATAPVAEQSKA